MRNEEEQKWKDLEGGLVHVRIRSVIPSSSTEVKVIGEILETEDYFELLVYIQE